MTKSRDFDRLSHQMDNHITWCNKLAKGGAEGVATTTNVIHWMWERMEMRVWIGEIYAERLGDINMV